MRRNAVALALTAVILAAGCGRGEPTSPASTTTTLQALSAPRPTDAPPVTRPLDLRRYLDKPCLLLTPKQQNTVGLPAGPPETAARDMCRWPVGVPGRYAILILALDLDFLGGVYRESNDQVDGKPKWGVFETRAIGGQPAVIRASVKGDVACEVVVGIAPNQAIDLTVGGGGSIDACARAVAIAEQMVKNLAA